LWRASIAVARSYKGVWSSLALGLSLPLSGDIHGDSLGNTLGDIFGDVLAKYGTSLR